MNFKTHFHLRKIQWLFIILLFNSVNLKAQKKTEIIWDNYGVPHVYANNEEEMYYALGWAQMHNHANLLLKLYAQARGCAAEYWGEDYIQSDSRIHLFNLPDSAQAKYKNYSGADKQYLDAFVAGINGYAKAYPNKIDPVASKLLPILATDVLAHSTRVICLEFLAKEDIASSMRQLAPGSNSYAIGPSKSASKNPMLVVNPHLPWSDLFLFFESQLTAPGFNTYGVSLVGFPYIIIGFNEHLGWTHTVNTIDASDRYELSLQDNGYLLDGKIEPFQKKTVTLNVLQKDGNVKQQDIVLTYSNHGPIIGEKANKAYAIRIAGLENAMLGQYHKMGKAKNLNEFENALKMMRNPMFNVIYADKGGNIFYLFNGNVPKRTEGDWAFWNGTVDGTQSKYIWNKYHNYADLPKLLNPNTGFLQNANDPPWTSTYPTVLDPKNFPTYMAPQSMQLRPQRAVNLIKGDSSITFDELIAYKMNTGMEAADRFLDDLFEAVKLYPDTVATKATLVLKQWDKATDFDSRGAVLFAKWFDKLNTNMYAVPWSLEHPVSSPDGLNNPKQAVELLAKAATEVEQIYGSLDVAWGDVYRFKAGEYDFPANGGPGNYGIFRTMNYQINKKDNKNYTYHGDSYVAVVEFGKKINAQVLLSYGNATQPGSKHIGDQIPLLSAKKLRPAFLTKKDVLLNMEDRMKLNIK
ncbi:MAG: acylase [Leadbetterella sp.]|nr:acylase [Leadbetterella sp.]